MLSTPEIGKQSLSFAGTSIQIGHTPLQIEVDSIQQHELNTESKERLEGEMHYEFRGSSNESRGEDEIYNH